MGYQSGEKRGDGLLLEEGSSIRGPVFHPPTQEIMTLAMEECVTPDRISVSDDCIKLRRISLMGG
jgi:hypothetical protein